MVIRAVLVWSALGVALSVPLIAAANSPLLAWREPIYIAAGLAGVLALALMVLQPLAIAGHLPGLTLRQTRRLHRVIGVVLALTVLVHVIGLWLTSPPDVVDALLLRSPTPFSAWGVLAMWAIAGAALLALTRKPLRLRWQIWRVGHASLALIAVLGTVVHALLIEGTMEPLSKIALTMLALAATLYSLTSLRIWTRTPRRYRT